MRCRQGLPLPHIVAVVEEVLHPGKRPRLRVGSWDAEDILQDALLLFVEKHESIQPGSWQAWIHSTLRNRERELFKKHALWRKYEVLLEAHLQNYGPWCVEPDASIRQQQVLFAVVWLLEKVAPSRRDVAERHLFDGASLAAIAAETGLPIGTVRSQWTRANKEMRAAIERERAKLDGVFIAIMLAILGAWCLWIAAHIRRVAGAASSGAERRRRGPAVACAVLPLAVLSHMTSAPVSPSDTVSCAESFETLAGASASEPLHEGDSLRDDVSHVLAPSLVTNAERERDGSARHALPRTARGAGAATGSAAAAPRTEAERKVGRGLLTRANTALQQGHESVARDALQLYDTDFPDNPFPALRAQVVSSLASRRSP